MASTEVKKAKAAKPAEEKKNNTAKTKHGDKDKESLVSSLSKYYGVEYGKDDQTFVNDLVKEANERAKQEQQDDPVEAAIYDQKIGQFRQMMEESNEKLSAEQKELRDALEKDYPAAHITFPDSDTWVLIANGREDSGHISASKDAVLAAANRLINPSSF